MLFHRAAVLGSDPDARRITNEFCAAGVSAASWILPGGCSVRAAAAFAELIASQGDWVRGLARTEITVTVFRDPRILDQAVVPHVLPHLPIGSVWLQLGRAADDETRGLARAAADHEISFLCPGRTPGPDAGGRPSAAAVSAAVRQHLRALSGFGAIDSGPHGRTSRTAALTTAGERRRPCPWEPGRPAAR
ncbi:hypothetical protein [Streptomyces sp. NPDC020141]|uniref:hypothetical protein n=1 Tax=Streptomyces sp. NPDC020141 TaxID=3365065 RepID=UPI0037AFAE4C